MAADDDLEELSSGLLVPKRKLPEEPPPADPLAALRDAIPDQRSKWDRFWDEHEGLLMLFGWLGASALYLIVPGVIGVAVLLIMSGVEVTDWVRLVGGVGILAVVAVIWIVWERRGRK